MLATLTMTEGMQSAASLLRALQSHATVGPGFAEEQPPPLALERLRSVLEASASEDEREMVSNSNMGGMYDRAATDGELLEEGVEQLLDLLSMPPSAVFADLGSGRGEALFHIAARRSLHSVVGVELLKTRNDRARATRDSLSGLGLLRSPVTLLQADLCDVSAWGPQSDSGLSGVTHAFTCSVCFDDLILRRIASTLGSRELCPDFQVCGLPTLSHVWHT